MSDKKASSGGSDEGRNGPPEKTDTAKSVSALLAEWEENRSGSDGKESPKAKDDVSEIKAKLEALEAERRAEREDKDYSELLSQIKGETDADDPLVDGWLRDRAKKDAAIAKVFDNRSDNPERYKELVNALKPEFKSYAESKFKRQDGGLAAAVRNARESSSEPAGFDGVNWGSLSDNEFAIKKQEVFRHAEKGGFK